MATPKSGGLALVLSSDNLALVLFIVAALTGMQVSAGYGVWGEEGPGPGLFPLLVCSMTIVASLISFIGYLYGLRQDLATEEGAAIQQGPILWRKLLLYILTILVWPQILSSLGFLLSTAAALIVIVRFAERAGWLETGILVTSALAGCWLLFVRALGVNLPLGIFAG